MSWDNFDIVKIETKVGCIHAKAPNGCERKTYRCRACGKEIKHQCGNNGLIGWHKCQSAQA